MRCAGDVYALGLTLYELLALRPAFAASDRHELMRRVMSEEPERLRALVPHLPRDLETIVHKAIDREPGQRYATAAALAEDLQRFLDDRPIQARRVTAAEQAWRWARRNPAVAALAAGLLVALVAGLAGVTWQWRQAVANLKLAEAANRKAQARFDLAMEAVRAFTTGASEDVILKEKALEGLRKKLLGQSRVFYEKLARSLQKARTDPLVAFGAGRGPLRRRHPVRQGQRPSKAIKAYRGAPWPSANPADPGEAEGPRVAARPGPQPPGAGGYPCPGIGSTRRASSWKRARGILQTLAASTPRMASRGPPGEAACDGQDGERPHRLDRHDEAEMVLQRSRALLERLIADNPAHTLPTAADGPTEYRRGLAAAIHVLGWIYVEQGRPAEALKNAEEQEAVFELLVSRPFATDADRRNLSHAETNIGGDRSGFGMPEDGMPAVKRGISICRQLVAENPASASDRIMLAFTLGASGSDPADGRRRIATEALSLLRTLSPEQRETHDAVSAEAMSETGHRFPGPGAAGRDEALDRARRPTSRHLLSDGRRSGCGKLGRCQR